MTTKVCYRYFENDACLAMVKSVLEPILELMPRSVLQIRVFNQGASDENATLSCSPNDRYRTVRINIFAEFYDSTKEDQRTAMIHEVVHALQGDLITWTKRYLLMPIKKRNEELYDAHADELQDRIEQVTEELTYVFERLLEKGVEP